ncbi:hypothetical protein [Amnibacterium kyonggiense]
MSGFGRSVMAETQESLPQEPAFPSHHIDVGRAISGQSAAGAAYGCGVSSVVWKT